MMTQRRIMALAAGGTGGHVFPARALAETLSARGWRIALVTDARGASFLDEIANTETHRIKAASLGGGVCSKLKGLTHLGVGLLQARALLRRISPSAAVGFGGYASAPTMWAAAQLGLPTMIHEQNAVLGRANRMIAGRARRIATSFSAVSGIRDKDRQRVTLTGNPVRADIATVGKTPYVSPADDGAIRLLVFGGSQGAKILSDVVPAAISALPAPLRARLEVVQQCRPENLDSVREIYRASNVRAMLETFFDDMPTRIADSHLVIGRAGASTVSELAAAGRPAILIPYRFAMDDHQTANAEAMQSSGAAWLMAEDDFTIEAVVRHLSDLFAAPDRLATTAAKALAAGHADAAERLADAAEAIANPANDNNASKEEAA
jgi:UDP-N-acetylglucosamine--N-acetylmuramyl-(pentapeptide) pyrophosphoryl-undecaprenol N-acetylglucosamine transferase